MDTILQEDFSDMDEAKEIYWNGFDNMGHPVLVSSSYSGGGGGGGSSSSSSSSSSRRRRRRRRWWWWSLRALLSGSGGSR